MCLDSDPKAEYYRDQTLLLFIYLLFLLIFIEDILSKTFSSVDFVSDKLSLNCSLD